MVPDCLQNEEGEYIEWGCSCLPCNCIESDDVFCNAGAISKRIIKVTWVLVAGVHGDGTCSCLLPTFDPIVACLDCLPGFYGPACNVHHIIAAIGSIADGGNHRVNAIAAMQPSVMMGYSEMEHALVSMTTIQPPNVRVVWSRILIHRM